MIARAFAWVRDNKARTAAMLAAFALAAFVGYVPLVAERLEEIEKRTQDVGKLKETFIEKKRLAVQREAYRAQLAAAGRCDTTPEGAAIAVPDGKSYDRIVRSAIDSGLRVEDLKVDDTRTPSEGVAFESPADLKLSGGYHQVGRFFESLGTLRDYAVVDAIKLERAEGGRLAIATRLRLVRVLTPEELEAARKSAPKKKGPGRK